MEAGYTFSSGLARAVRWAKRRERLNATNHFCPNCRTKQVQLVAWILTPAMWKCRECQAEFSYEPKADMVGG